MLRPSAGRLFIRRSGALRTYRGGEATVSSTQGPPTNIMTPPAQGWAQKISDDLDALPAGGTLTLARGIYELDFRTHPQNTSYRTCITVPNGKTFDFSQAELRLKPGQPRMVSGGLTTGQLADMITNRGLGSDTNKATNITIVVGCLNGQAELQGALNATNSEGSSECWFDGIALVGAQGCTITGSTASPWARTVGAQRGDGAAVTVQIRGVIKNIRGWDGNGGRTETFSYDFLEPRTGNVVEYIETTNDDGTTRSSTGGSCNGMDVTITQNATTPTTVTHRNIYGHGLRSHGATSWHTISVVRQNSLFEDNVGSGFRYEYGWNHNATDVISRSNDNNGLNLKGEEFPPAGTTMFTSTRLTCVDNTFHAAQINSIVGATFSGWARWTSGRQKVHFADQLYGPRASTGVSSGGWVQV